MQVAKLRIHLRDRLGERSEKSQAHSARRSIDVAGICWPEVVKRTTSIKDDQVSIDLSLVRHELPS